MFPERFVETTNSGTARRSFLLASVAEALRKSGAPWSRKLILGNEAARACYARVRGTSRQASVMMEMVLQVGCGNHLYIHCIFPSL